MAKERAKLIQVSPCIYQQAGTKKFFHAFRPDGGAYRTKRKLTATTITAARAEVETLNTRRREAKIGVGIDPYAAGLTVGQLADKWLAVNCPDRKGRQRSGDKLKSEKAALERALGWWRNKELQEIRRKDCGSYRDWRVKQSKVFKLTRSVDRELLTLSNLFEWAVDEDIMRHNPIAGRKHFDDAALVRHCTKVMPTSDEQFHQLAAYLLAGDKSRPLGWQLLLEGLTGCRTSEILALRTDAILPDKPGYMDHIKMTVPRRKDGIKPWALLEAVAGHSPLRDCLNAFLNWHEQRFAHTPYFIPNRKNVQKAADRMSLTHALESACTTLKIPKVTSHGLRAYFVAAMRSLGVTDAEIAARLGHKNTSQVEQTYGTVEPGWFGSWKMDFLPEDSAPAWAAWTPKNAYRFLIVPKAEEGNQTKQTAGIMVRKAQ